MYTVRLITRTKNVFPTFPCNQPLRTWDRRHCGGAEFIHRAAIPPRSAPACQTVWPFDSASEYVFIYALPV